MRTPLLFSFVALLAFIPSAWAQEDTPVPDPEAKKPKTALERSAEEEAEQAGAQELFSAALIQLKRQRDVIVRTSVKHKQPAAEAGNVAGPGRAQIRGMILTPGFGNEGPPFEGDVEAWRDADGVTVIVSEKELPGFGLFLQGERTIKRVTFENEAPGLSRLKHELTSLLEGERMVKYLLEARLGHVVDPKTGDHIWAGKVSKGIIPVEERAIQRGGVRVMMFGGMQPRVLRAEMEIRIDKEGALKSATVRVTRNDPSREMMRGMGGIQVIVQGAGGVPVPLQPNNQNGKDKKETIEGKTTVYTLDYTQKQPSERATAFKREILRSLKDVDTGE